MYERPSNKLLWYKFFEQLVSIRPDDESPAFIEIEDSSSFKKIRSLQPIHTRLNARPLLSKSSFNFILRYVLCIRLNFRSCFIAKLFLGRILHVNHMCSSSRTVKLWWLSPCFDFQRPRESALAGLRRTVWNLLFKQNWNNKSKRRSSLYWSRC
jgi:hypothetical protein